MLYSVHAVIPHIPFRIELEVASKVLERNKWPLLVHRSFRLLPDTTNPSSWIGRTLLWFIDDNAPYHRIHLFKEWKSMRIIFCSWNGHSKVRTSTPLKLWEMRWIGTVAANLDQLNNNMKLVWDPASRHTPEDIITLMSRRIRMLWLRFVEDTESIEDGASYWGSSGFFLQKYDYRE